MWKVRQTEGSEEWVRQDDVMRHGARRGRDCLTTSWYRDMRVLLDTREPIGTRRETGSERGEGERESIYATAIRWYTNVTLLLVLAHAVRKARRTARRKRCNRKKREKERKKISRQMKITRTVTIPQSHNLLAGLIKLRNAGDSPPRTVWRRRCRHIRHVIHKQHKKGILQNNDSHRQPTHTTQYSCSIATWALAHALASSATASREDVLAPIRVKMTPDKEVRRRQVLARTQRALWNTMCCCAPMSQSKPAYVEQRLPPGARAREVLNSEYRIENARELLGEHAWEVMCYKDEIMRGLRRSQRTWIHNPDRRTSLGSTSISARNPNLRGDHPAAHHGGKKVQGRTAEQDKEERVRQAEMRAKKAEKQIKHGWLSLNVCGLRAVFNENATNQTPEAGDGMKYEASKKLFAVMKLMKAQQVKVAVLSDTHHNEEQAKAVREILKDNGYASYGTEGIESGASRTRGVLVVWDTKEIQVKEKNCQVIQDGRIVKVVIEVIRDQKEITVIGAYMPVRSDANRVEVDESWNALSETVEEAGEKGHVAVGGDLNAETPQWRESKGVSRVTHADTRFAQLLEESELIPKTRGHTFRAGTQIDHWLFSPTLDGHTDTAYTLPGVCGDDHSAVLAKYYVDIETITNRKERPLTRWHVI